MHQKVTKGRGTDFIGDVSIH